MNIIGILIEERDEMNRDTNLTYEVYQCQECKAIWESNAVGYVKYNGEERRFCRLCQCEDLQRIETD